MPSVKVVTNGNGTIVRNIDMSGSSTRAVDQAATALESIISCEKEILHVEVDYNGCDDSKTIEGNT